MREHNTKRAIARAINAMQGNKTAGNTGYGGRV